MTSHNITRSSDDSAEGSVMRELSVLRLQEGGHCGEERDQKRVMIDILPDITLLDIFDVYKEDPTYHIDVQYALTSCQCPWRWKTLTQVCRRWRDVILESPRRLDLRVVCTQSTPTRTSLDIWPPFPINIISLPQRVVDEKGVENIIAALEHRHHISVIAIDDIRSSALEILMAELCEPLPILTDFELRCFDNSAQVLPATFLGGSAPLLESFMLLGIAFPTFPKFILSAAHISEIRLFDIPNSGYIPPEVMVTCLVALPKLEVLSIGFRNQPPLLQTNLSPSTRAVFPALTSLHLNEINQYSEDFVDRIDTPLLNKLSMWFFANFVFDDISRLHNFIGRSERCKSFKHATMVFSNQEITLTFDSPTIFELEIIRGTPDRQLSSMTQIFTHHSGLPTLLSQVEELGIREDPSEDLNWDYNSNMDPSQWLELFGLFIALRSLYVSEILVPPIAATLLELRDGSVEVLPALRNIYFEGNAPIHEAMRSFVAARQLSGQTIAVRRWG